MIEDKAKQIEYINEVADTLIYDNKKKICDLELTILDEKKALTNQIKQNQQYLVLNKEEEE